MSKFDNEIAQWVAVAKGGEGSGRYPKGSGADPTSLFAPRSGVTVVSASPLFSDPNRQDPFWFSDSKSEPVAVLTDASGLKYKVDYAGYDASMETADGEVFSTIAEAEALGIHNDADLATRVRIYQDDAPHFGVSVSGVNSDDMYDRLEDWSNENWENGDAYANGINYVNNLTNFISSQPENKGADQPKPDTARTWIPAMRLQSVSLAGAKLNGQGRQIGTARMKELHNSLYAMHMDSAERAVVAGNKLAEEGKQMNYELAQKLHDLADLHEAAALAHKTASTKAQSNYEPAMAASDATQKAFRAEESMSPRGLALMEAEPGFRLFDQISR